MLPKDTKDKDSEEGTYDVLKLLRKLKPYIYNSAAPTPPYHSLSATNADYKIAVVYTHDLAYILCVLKHKYLKCKIP